MDDDTAASIGKVLPRIARAIMKVTGAKCYNVLQNNGSMAHQVVPHVHFHIIPKYSKADGLGVGDTHIDTSNVHVNWYDQDGC